MIETEVWNSTVLHVFCGLSDRKWLFDVPPEDPNYNPLPEERPGGYNWGEGAPAQAEDNEERPGDDQWQQSCRELKC